MQLAASYARWHLSSSQKVEKDGGGGSGTAVTRLQGEALTVAGPPPAPEIVASGSGTILDEPNLLWCEDVWNDEREAAAVERTSAAVQGPVLAPSMVRRYEREAKLNWDLFYKRNGTNFFKDRHYLDTVFPELRAPEAAEPHGGSPRQNKRFLEVGCGVGNAFLPLLESNPGLDGVAIDFSPVAIDHLRGTEAYRTLRSGGEDHSQTDTNATAEVAAAGNSGHTRLRARSRRRCVAHVCDVTADELPRFGWDYDDATRINIGRSDDGAGSNDGNNNNDDDDDGGYDVILLLFCLSAVAPHKMPAVVAKLARALRPGGALLFRDYGRYDHAQLRFRRGRRLGEHFYVKQDGTRVYYFTRHDVEALFCRPWLPGPGVPDPGVPDPAAHDGGTTSTAAGSAAAAAATALGTTTAAPSPHSSPSLLPPQFSTMPRDGAGDPRAPSPSTSAEAVAGAAGEAPELGPQLRREELDYIRRQYANRAEQVARFRVWVHGKFTKPPLLSSSES